MKIIQKAMGLLLACLPIFGFLNANAQTPTGAVAPPVAGALQVISFGGGFTCQSGRPGIKAFLSSMALRFSTPSPPIPNNCSRV